MKKYLLTIVTTQFNILASCLYISTLEYKPITHLFSLSYISLLLVRSLSISPLVLTRICSSSSLNLFSYSDLYCSLKGGYKRVLWISMLDYKEIGYMYFHFLKYQQGEGITYQISFYFVNASETIFLLKPLKLFMIKKFVYYMYYEILIRK